MSKSLGALGLVGAISFWGAQAGAEAAPKGIAVGVERAFGIVSTKQTTEQGGVSATRSTTEVGLGVGYPTGVTSLARFGIDYLADGGMSIGTGFGVDWMSGESETENAGVTTSADGPGATVVVFSPRVGYVVQVADSLALWPRGGLTYAVISSEVTTINQGVTTTFNTSVSDLFFTLEVPLVILPARNFGFLLAPTLDYGVSHSSELDGTESDASVSTMALGLRFGVVGVL